MPLPRPLPSGGNASYLWQHLSDLLGGPQPPRSSIGPMVGVRKLPGSPENFNPSFQNYMDQFEPISAAMPDKIPSDLARMSEVFGPEGAHGVFDIGSMNFPAQGYKGLFAPYVGLNKTLSPEDKLVALARIIQDLEETQARTLANELTVAADRPHGLPFLLAGYEPKPVEGLDDMVAMVRKLQPRDLVQQFGPIRVS